MNRTGCSIESLCLLLGLLGQEHAVDVGQDTAGSDGDAAEELAQLLIIADGQLDVAGHDAVLLVVAGRVAGELKHLGSEVLEDGGQVDRGAGADALGILSLLEVAGDAAHGELQAGLGGAAHGLLAGGLSLSASRHVCRWCKWYCSRR